MDVQIADAPVDSIEPHRGHDDRSDEQFDDHPQAEATTFAEHAAIRTWETGEMMKMARYSLISATYIVGSSLYCGRTKTPIADRSHLRDSSPRTRPSWSPERLKTSTPRTKQISSVSMLR